MEISHSRHLPPPLLSGVRDLYWGSAGKAPRGLRVIKSRTQAEPMRSLRPSHGGRHKIPKILTKPGKKSCNSAGIQMERGRVRLAAAAGLRVCWPASTGDTHGAAAGGFTSGTLRVKRRATPAAFHPVSVTAARSVCACANITSLPLFSQHCDSKVV